MVSDERRTQSLLETVKKARAEYEVRQDEVQAAKDTYYRAVRRLHEDGMPLREVASALGLSHQRVHQMISESQDTKKARLARRARRAAGAAGAVLIAVGIVAGAWAWTGGDDDDARPQPAATDRLAASPSSPARNFDVTVRLEDLQRAQRRLSRALQARLRGRDWVIEVPSNSGLRFYIERSARRAAEGLIK